MAHVFFFFMFLILPSLLRGWCKGGATLSLNEANSVAPCRTSRPSGVRLSVVCLSGIHLSDVRLSVVCLSGSRLLSVPPLRL